MSIGEGPIGDSFSAVSRRITVIGLGHVGLTTAACFAHLGHEVWGVDSSSSHVDRVSGGHVDFFEEGLPKLVAEGLANGRLHVSTQHGRVAPEFVFVCTPTPSIDGRLDATITADAISHLRPFIDETTIIVVKSTVPVGFTVALGPRAVSNPEYLRAGTGPYDFLHPERIVIGATDVDAGDAVAGLYDGLGPVVRTDPSSSELAKLAANSFLAIKVSFINELTQGAEAHEADTFEVARILGMDRRIGPAFLTPGPGWGGPCLPKDSGELAAIGMSLVGAAREVNHAQPQRVVAKVAEACGGSVAGRKIAVWGIAFKPGSEDLLESPAMRVVRVLRAAGAQVCAYDRLATHPDLDMAASPLAACHGADVLLVFDDQPVETEHIPVRAVVDAVNSRPVDEWRRAGLLVFGLGRR